ncbi:MAG TPA: iron-sulfur cluster assembly scaffold protein [Rhizomicrobium sp.]
MSDPLYRKELLRLAADATGAGHLVHPDGTATAHNLACGDRVTVEVLLEDGLIAALAHQTQACVLTQASAAILAAHAKGLDEAGLKALAEDIAAMLSGGSAPVPPFQDYGVFDGVAGHKGRHKCVLLPLEAALAATLEAAKPGT